MATSTYTYCFHGCVVDWFLANSNRLGLAPFAGVVGVDHYWTKQGMPCVNGEPQEFAHQAALAAEWKASFPGLRFMTYRILSAVPYDMTIRNAMLQHPDWFVRWEHLPGSDKPGNGSICFNYISACFNDPTRINNPAHNCSFEIRAAAYNWPSPDVRAWFLQQVIAPALDYADGVWLDGNGPDNGAYMCSGICCGFGPDNSPHNQQEIDSFCDSQRNVTTAVQQYLVQHGAFEIMKCANYLSGAELPHVGDSPQSCSQKLQRWAAWGANHSNYNLAVAYGSRTAGTDHWSDSSANGTVAAFMLMRGQHWLLSISNTNSIADETARLLTRDDGKPLGPMRQVSANVFARDYEGATVQLDCSTFQGTFTSK